MWKTRSNQLNRRECVRELHQEARRSRPQDCRLEDFTPHHTTAPLLDQDLATELSFWRVFPACVHIPSLHAIYQSFEVNHA